MLEKLKKIGEGLRNFIHIKIFKLILVVLIAFFNSLFGQDTIDHIIITTTPGGAEVQETSMYSYESVTFWASAYDAGNNYIGVVSAVWSKTGSLDPVSVSGTSCTFVPNTPQTSGMIIASYNGLSDTTGIINVLDSGLHYITIRDAPDGGGTEFDAHTMTADESVTLYAAGYDASDNYLMNINANWSL